MVGGHVAQGEQQQRQHVGGVEGGEGCALARRLKDGPAGEDAGRVSGDVGGGRRDKAAGRHPWHAQLLAPEVADQGVDEGAAQGDPAGRRHTRHQVGRDGNHRLEAIHLLGWKTVFCENFGGISKGEAVLIARRRNYQWFDDDVLKLAELFRDEVIPEITIEDMTEFMPDTKQELQDLTNLLDYDWNRYDGGGSSSGSSKSNNEKELVIDLDSSVGDKWQEWKEKISQEGYFPDEKILEMALEIAIDNHEE